MSRAFVSEQDGDATGGDLPERPLSPHPNYVTPAGIEALRAQAAAWRAERDAAAGADDLAARARVRALDRDLRWVAARIASASVVDPASQSHDRVRFGSVVEVADEDAVIRTYRIVGEDEADADAGKVSWVSPLARVLLGASVGDEVTWRRPAGDLRLTVVSIAAGGG